LYQKRAGGVGAVRGFLALRFECVQVSILFAMNGYNVLLCQKFFDVNIHDSELITRKDVAMLVSCLQMPMSSGSADRQHTNIL
jgi:hypothetical protein